MASNDNVASGCDLARGPGRPVQIEHHERERLVLDAAQQILARCGLAGASMSAIAREAGMSKRTVYELFESREQLIAASVRRVRLSLVRPLSGNQLDLPLAERLKLLLMPDCEILCSDLPLETLRAAIAEARNQPELAGLVLHEGSHAVVEVVREELERARCRGEIEIDDPEACASMLRDMVYGNVCDILLNPAREPTTQCALRARLELAVRVFLFGVGGRARAVGE